VEVPAELTGHLIVTGAEGRLDTPTTTVESVRKNVGTMVRHGRGVVHFHGGLVSAEKGVEIAADLLPIYTDADAYPIFFVWGSDVVAIVGGNLKEIAEEEIFQRLLKKVLAYAAGKVKDELGIGKGTESLTPETPLEVAKQLKRRERKEEPFAELPVAAEVPELTDEELSRFESEIKADDELLAHVDAAVKGADPDAEPRRAKGVVVRIEVADGSLLDPATIAELQGRPDQPVARGFGFETAALVRKGVKVLVAVIRRHRSGRWHGLYATVVEELLREFYLANVGGALWATMKRETLDTFQPGKEPRGGEQFLAALASALPGADRPAISLVGHSTGAVFIDNLLQTVAADGSKYGLPGDFRFRNVVFLAPANTFADFAAVVERHDEYWERFRLFAMTDEAERADRVFSFIYPHSLLYLVSGVLERDATGKSEGGKPLVGLQRWCLVDQNDPAELALVRRLFEGDAEVLTWSPGERSGAIHHGDFDNDPLVRETLKQLIREP
jgi:hypothetical protein